MSTSAFGKVQQGEEIYWPAGKEVVKPVTGLEWRENGNKPSALAAVKERVRKAPPAPLANGLDTAYFENPDQVSPGEVIPPPDDEKFVEFAADTNLQQQVRRQRGGLAAALRRVNALSPSATNGLDNEAAHFERPDQVSRGEAVSLPAGVEYFEPAADPDWQKNYVQMYGKEPSALAATMERVRAPSIHATNGLDTKATVAGFGNAVQADDPPRPSAAEPRLAAEPRDRIFPGTQQIHTHAGTASTWQEIRREVLDFIHRFLDIFHHLGADGRRENPQIETWFRDIENKLPFDRPNLPIQSLVPTGDFLNIVDLHNTLLRIRENVPSDADNDTVMGNFSEEFNRLVLDIGGARELYRVQLLRDAYHAELGGHLAASDFIRELPEAGGDAGSNENRLLNNYARFFAERKKEIDGRLHEHFEDANGLLREDPKPDYSPLAGHAFWLDMQNESNEKLDELWELRRKAGQKNTGEIGEAEKLAERLVRLAGSTAEELEHYASLELENPAQETKRSYNPIKWVRNNIRPGDAAWFGISAATGFGVRWAAKTYMPESFDSLGVSNLSPHLASGIKVAATGLVVGAVSIGLRVGFHMLKKEVTYRRAHGRFQKISFRNSPNAISIRNSFHEVFPTTTSKIVGFGLSFGGATLGAAAAEYHETLQNLGTKALNWWHGDTAHAPVVPPAQTPVRGIGPGQPQEPHVSTNPAPLSKQTFQPPFIAQPGIPSPLPPSDELVPSAPQNLAPSTPAVPAPPPPPAVPLSGLTGEADTLLDQAKEQYPDLAGKAEAAFARADDLHGVARMEDIVDHLSNDPGVNDARRTLAASLNSAAVEIAENRGLHDAMAQVAEANQAYFQLYGIGTPKDVPSALEHAKNAGRRGAKFVNYIRNVLNYKAMPA